MNVVNIHQAKTHLSEYLKAVAEGKEIIIGKYGEPVARLVPFNKHARPRKGGILKGKVRVAKDFDVLPPDFAQHFAD